MGCFCNDRLHSIFLKLNVFESFNYQASKQMFLRYCKQNIFIQQVASKLNQHSLFLHQACNMGTILNNQSSILLKNSLQCLKKFQSTEETVLHNLQDILKKMLQNITKILKKCFYQIVSLHDESSLR